MKKLIFTLLILPLLILSCTKEGDDSKENLALIKNYIQAVENLDYDTMETVLDDNYLGLGPSYGDSIGKVAAIKNWKYNVEHLYETIDYSRSRNAALSIADGENQGEWVSNWAELHISYKGDKESVIIWANSIYQIKDNKIVKSYTFYNEADALEQLGYVFINPNNL